MPLTPTRRQTVIGLTGLLAGGAGVYHATQPAQAEITTNELSVADASHTSQDGNVHDVWCVISGDWSYTVETGADTYVIRLFAGPSSTEYQKIAENEHDAMADSMAAPFTISGPVTSHADLSSSTFDAPDGETKTVQIAIRLNFAVFDSVGDTLVAAAAEDTAEVVLTDEGVVESGFVQGDGSLELQINESDATPSA